MRTFPTVSMTARLAAAPDLEETMSRAQRRHERARLLAKYREVATRIAGRPDRWSSRSGTRAQYVERTARQLASFHHSCTWCRPPSGGYQRQRWMPDEEE